ncbi:MAG TPA: stage III sporulation protein AD [Candidatus Enterenecus stercoripullorum]|nr:stage III sporulation protein AD [Candidatus Enterenecus stercoripullorum]
MSDVVKVAAAAILAAVCAMVVRKQVPELAILLAVCAGALILLYCSGALAAAVELLDRLADLGGLSPQVLTPMMKAVGIGVVTRLASDFCKDAQEGALAGVVELAGTALALAAVLPLMSAVLDLLTQLL